MATPARTTPARPDIVYQTNAKGTGCALTVWWFERDGSTLVTDNALLKKLATLLDRSADHTLAEIKDGILDLGFDPETEDGGDMTFVVSPVFLHGGPLIIGSEPVRGTVHLVVSVGVDETEVDLTFHDDNFALRYIDYRIQPRVGLADLNALAFRLSPCAVP